MGIGLEIKLLEVEMLAIKLLEIEPSKIMPLEITSSGIQGALLMDTLQGRTTGKTPLNPSSLSQHMRFGAKGVRLERVCTRLMLSRHGRGRHLRKEERGTHLLLALVVRLLTTHPFGDGARGGWVS